MRTTTYTIECDGCLEGPLLAEIAELQRETRKRAEDEARRRGWRLGKRDLCPKCIVRRAGPGDQQ